MLKKLMLATLATLLVIPADVVAKKCKNFCSVNTQSLRVCNNAVINGNLTVDGTITNSTFSSSITEILTTLAGLSANHVFAYSTEIQTYDGDGTTFTPITFNVNGIISGWTHVAGSENFTVPATGLYEVSYSANIGIPAVADTFPAAIAAFSGTLGSETQIAGSDSSIQFTSAAGAVQIFTASSTFLLNATAGQNFFLGLLADDDSGVTLTNPDLEGIDTSISLTITRVR
jgi:hypothetical protein